MRVRTLIGAACAIAGAGLVGCSQNHAAANGQTISYSGSGRYCLPFQKVSNTNGQTAPAPAASGDPAASFEDCLHRWGYALAPARDPADIVAQAAVAECSSYLSQWNQQALDQNPQGASQGVSLTTGQPTDLMGEHAQYAQTRALFYVVQSRAGNCAAPPADQMAELATPTAGTAPPTGQAAQTPPTGAYPPAPNGQMAQPPGALPPAPPSRYGAG